MLFTLTLHVIIPQCFQTTSEQGMVWYARSRNRARHVIVLLSPTTTTLCALFKAKRKRTSRPGFIVLWCMSGSFPIYETYTDCVEECGLLVSQCVGTAPFIVCQLNIVVFLVCIILAVSTGILIPVICILCYISNWCTDMKRFWQFGRSTDDEAVRLHPRTLQVTLSDCGTPVASSYVGRFTTTGQRTNTDAPGASQHRREDYLAEKLRDHFEHEGQRRHVDEQSVSSKNET
ncbi:hypothetical protein DICVIV_12724 [Dictyocaulus viviparus]|uniref:Uncharacterized protein n=1 Tax=Dictyocaulus viviparus TaxID=29172 RepID=A0A0D8XC25_DICVI|nr:hypothetical protein DICVIV_12724 [Dictyocaulus viviparus]